MFHWWLGQKSIDMLICHDINLWSVMQEFYEKGYVSGLDGLDSYANRNFSDRMHEDRSAGFDQPPSTERANKPWIGFLPALHYPSIYWWHYVMVSIIQPWTWDRGLLWLTLSFFIYITAKPVGYIYPKEISINTVKFLYQTIAHLDSSACYLRDRLHWRSEKGNEFHYDLDGRLI